MKRLMIISLYVVLMGSILISSSGCIALAAGALAGMILSDASNNRKPNTVFVATPAPAATPNITVVGMGTVITNKGTRYSGYWTISGQQYRLHPTASQTNVVTFTINSAQVSRFER